MGLSPEFAEMIEHLAAMPAADRDFVMAALGSDGERRLAPLVEQAGQVEVSDKLKTLLNAVEQGATPSGMTKRAADALSTAARLGQAQRISAAVPLANGRSRPYVAQLMQRLGLGG